jgi:hypothetical protein
MASHRGADIAASGFGALLFTALYAVIAGQDPRFVPWQHTS